MACTSKYYYATEQLAKTPAHRIYFKKYMACPVINPDTGFSLEYRHLIQGPDKDIWVKSLANDFVRLAQGVKGRMPTGNSTGTSWKQRRRTHRCNPRSDYSDERPHR